jgi:hypothetical protein
MGSGYYSYDEMATFMDELQRRVAELEAENSGLRQQLEALRQGVGISVNILGRALPLASEGQEAPPATDRMRQRMPLPAPHTPHSPAGGPFPEDAWLTGKGPAARQQRQEQPAQPAQWGQQQQQQRDPRPSERITPQWLREGPQGQGQGHGQGQGQHAAPAPSPFSPRASGEDAWADSYPAAGTPERHAQHGHGQPQSLAGWAEQPRTRNPYADSFVLD